MRWHSELTLDKWIHFGLEHQLLMIQNELSRAQHAQESGYYGSTQLALERALELLDLTVEAHIGDNVFRKLLRWRERVARAYLLPEEEIAEALFDLEAPVKSVFFKG
ncbi:MAG: hypothetical protein HY717_24285 [Planctomycetes bacterium]|nr:hypothetical protein [Planctomycetota bacterium]